MRVQKYNKNFFSINSKFINNFLSVIIVAVVFLTTGFFIFDFKIVNASSENITQLNIITAPQTLDIDTPSSLITVQTQNINNAFEKVSEATHLTLTSSSPTGKFFDANASSGTCTDILQEPFTLTLRSGSSNKSFCYQDSASGSHTINVSAVGKSWTNASQVIVINGSDNGGDTGDTGDGGDDGTGNTGGGDTGNDGGQDNIYTEITEDISNDATWTKENGIYVINSLISVLPGITLNINEGVIVKFGNEGGLIVNGKLNVSGIDSDKVSFTSINDDTLGGDTGGDGSNSLPNYGDWQYIFIDSDMESNLNNLIMKYSNDGIILYYDTPVLISNLISDNKITAIGVNGSFNNLNITGLEIFDHSNISISNSDIYSDSDNVVSVYNNSSINLTNSNIGSDRYSISIFGNSSASLNNSNIYSYDNSIGSAVSVFNGSSLDVQDSKFECAYDCIWAYSNSSLDLSGGSISGLHDGIDVYSNENKNINIENTKISDSLNAGLMVFGNLNSSIKITKSEIYNNDYGFIVFDSPISVSGNSIHDNFSAGAITYTETDLDFTSNYWGDKTGPTHSSNASGLGDLISDHILYTPFLSYDPLSENMRNPVILIPGITGTYLYKNYGDHEEIWPNLLKMIFSKDDDYLNDLSLDIYGKENFDTPILVGDAIRGVSIPVFGDVHIFDLLIDGLKSNGYVEGEDLFVFPYDWRFSTTKSANELKDKIDSVINNTGYQKVDIIAHSMGGLIAKKYIADNGPDKIDQLIFLGTPQLGSPKAFKVLMFGDDMSYGIDLFKINDTEVKVNFLSPYRAKYISQNMPAVYELLPSREYLSLNGGYVYRPATGMSTLYSMLNYDQTRQVMEDDGRNPLMFPFAESLHNDVDNLDLSSVKTYNFVGCASETIGRITISEEKSWIKNIFGKKIDYQIQYTDGDSTVPLVSADKVAGAKTYYVNGISHGSLPSPQGIINGLVSIMNNKEVVFDDTFQDDSSRCGIEGDVLSVHSPVEIHIYDEDGNHVGPNENGDIEYGIPGVSYDVLDDVKYVFLPKGKNYKIIIKALDTGGFNLSVEEQSGEDIVDTHNWTLIPLRSENSSGEILIGPDYPSDEYMIKMDDDGDGYFDKDYTEGFDGTSEAEKETKRSSHIISGSILPTQNIITKIPRIEKTFLNDFSKDIVQLSIKDDNEKMGGIIQPPKEQLLKLNNNYKAEVASTDTKVKIIFPIIIFFALLIILLVKMFIKL